MKRSLIILVAALALTATAYLLCPRPELEAARSGSRAFFDSQGRLLRLTLAADDRFRLPCPLERIAPRLVETGSPGEGSTADQLGQKEETRAQGCVKRVLARFDWSVLVP